MRGVQAVWEREGGREDSVGSSQAIMLMLVVFR